VRRWCLCDTDLCNRFPIHQNYHRLPATESQQQTHQTRGRSRVHHHPLPPPQPAPVKNYFKDSGDADTTAVEEEEKVVQPALYRTIWTNWQAVPGAKHRGQPADRPENTERKTEGGSRMVDHLGHVVSHSVYPDRWKENVAGVVDRRHAKSSENVARGRPEPLAYNGEGQMPRSNYSEPRRVQQYRPPTVEADTQPASTAEIQSPRGMYYVSISSLQASLS